ncbi:MAG: type II toxin-antitoxin system RelE/ParE family toxin [Planctomycetes bacterium]|nr:type II toxin-antitoxin system RelE/ParE family toxin [Planctomycetota bacterium]
MVRIQTNRKGHDHPLRHHVRVRKLKARFVAVPGFPYIIVYRVKDDEVVIYSVVHSARDKRVWRDRF